MWQEKNWNPRHRQWLAVSAWLNEPHQNVCHQICHLCISMNWFIDHFGHTPFQVCPVDLWDWDQNFVINTLTLVVLQPLCSHLVLWTLDTVHFEDSFEPKLLLPAWCPKMLLQNFFRRFFPHVAFWFVVCSSPCCCTPTTWLVCEFYWELRVIKQQERLYSQIEYVLSFVWWFYQHSANLVCP